MNNYNLIGKVVQPPGDQPAVTITSRKRGRTELIARFSLAVYDSFQKESDFFRCTAFGKVADIVEKYVNAGDTVGVTGRMKNYNFGDPASDRRYTLISFVIEKLTLFPRDKGGKRTVDYPGGQHLKVDASDEDFEDGDQADTNEP